MKDSSYRMPKHGYSNNHGQTGVYNHYTGNMPLSLMADSVYVTDPTGQPFQYSSSNQATTNFTGVERVVEYDGALPIGNPMTKHWSNPRPVTLRNNNIPSLIRAGRYSVMSGVFVSGGQVIQPTYYDNYDSYM